MKNVTRAVVLGLMLLPVVAAVTGCNARRCNSEPVVLEQRLEKMKTEYVGK